MATSLTRNLKLRIDSNLTANAKYNLERIDTLGTTFLVDTTDQLNIRSLTDITIEPESADVGGSGSGGTVNIGTQSHELSEVNVYASAFNLSDAVGLLDQASSGTKYLRIKYKSDLSGAVDTTADRALSIDLQGADRSLVLAGNLSTVGGSLSLTMSADSALTLPTTGTVATLAGTEVLTNKTIDADNNSISNIVNANIKANAGIVYSKLNLSSSIVNADISPSAAIVYSKLSLSDSIVNSDINSAAGIAYSKLNLASSIVNADVSNSAAISGSKVAPAFGNQVVSTTDRFRLNNGTWNTDLKFASASQTQDLLFRLPHNYGTSGQVLETDGSGNLSWATVSGGGGSGSVDAAETNWLTADGTTKTFTHSLNSTDITVSVIDLDDDKIICIPEITVTDANNISLTSSEAPANSWRVIVFAHP